MTVEENLQVGGVVRSGAEVRERLADIYELFPRLGERRRQVGGTLSGGEQQMLAIGRALMSRPSFILMDEPSLGLAPLVVERVHQTIDRIRREMGIGGILVEQNVAVALGVASHAYVLMRGVGRAGRRRRKRCRGLAAVEGGLSRDDAIDYARLMMALHPGSASKNTSKETYPRTHQGAEDVGPSQRRRTIVAVLALLSAWALASPAAAQDYPSRTITLVVAFPAGGGVDTVGRLIAQKLTAALGHQVIVENRPGAGSVIGSRTVAKAPADGYTLLLMVTGLSLPANTGYDVAKDFAPIGLIASVPIVVMANPSVPATSISDVIALAKKDPGKLTMGTPPPPTLNYFGAEQFKAMTGTDITIVTYKGTGPLTNDLVGGHVMLAFNTLPPAIGNIEGGKLRAIAVASPERVAALPNVPTVAESGLPGFDVVQYYGLAAPAGTPRPIIDRLNNELRAIVMSEDIRNRIVADGGGPVTSTPEDYAENIRREEGKWDTLIKKLGLTVN